MPTWLTAAVAVLAVVLLTVTTTLALLQRGEIAELRDDVADLEARLSEVEAQVPEGGAGFEDLLRDLLEGGGEDLLDGLDGQDPAAGDFDDLFSGDAAALAQCVRGDAALMGGDPVDADDLDAQLDGIADRVAELRELDIDEAVDPELLTSDDFTARLTRLVEEDYTEEQADLDARLLTALGAVDADVDLRALRTDLVGEQAAGFYEPDTGDLVVRVEDPNEPLGPAEQVIYAHEVEHAMADQVLGLPAGGADQPEESDAARAALGLVEGDATLTMQRYAMSALSMGEQMAMATDPSIAQEREQLDGYPAYLQRELLFPYTEGLAFVCELYADGGWDAVNEAYEELPTTSAQILWPERYVAGDEEVDTDPPADLARPWEQARGDTFGAADLLWLFEAPGDDPDAALTDPRELASAWAGGQFALWTRGDDTALGVTLVDGEGTLCGSVADWYGAAFPEVDTESVSGDEELVASGDSQDAVIACGDDEVRVGIAPDLDTARQLAG
jgi:hypothetical protein